SLEELESAWQTLAPPPQYTVLRAPEIGLAMVRGRVGGSGDPFNLGEMTMTRCAVRLASPSRRVGLSFITGRDRRRAELAAVYDALLQDGTSHALIDQALLQPVARRLAIWRRRRATEVAATKVEFFTLVRERENV